MWWIELGYALWLAAFPVPAPPVPSAQAPSIEMLEFLGEFAVDASDQAAVDPLLLIEAMALGGERGDDERR